MHTSTQSSSSDCTCGNVKFPAFVVPDQGPGADGPPLIEALYDLSQVFPQDIPFDQPDVFWNQLGTSLVGSAQVIRGFRELVSGIGLDDGGSRERFADGVASALFDLQVLVEGAGFYVLDQENDIDPTTLGQQAADAADRLGRAFVRNVPDPGREREAFARYGSALGTIGGAYANLLAAFDDVSVGKKVGTEIAETFTRVPVLIGSRLKGLQDILLAGASTRNESAYPYAKRKSYPPEAAEEPFPIPPPELVSQAIPTCPEECPFRACTIYCTDSYTTRLICTPPTWATRLPGVHTILCTWDVIQTKKSVCACYPSRWSRFWAINQCGGVQVSRTFTKRMEDYRHYAFGSKPTALPAPFDLSCGIDRV